MKHPLAAGAVLVLLAAAPGAWAAPPPVPLRQTASRSSPRPTAEPHTGASSLYSRRSRRLVQSYLRLKLWEMREADLERARKVIERKLGIGHLLGETPSPAAR